MNKVIGCVFVFFGSFGFSFSQSLQGTITDAETGKPVADVQVKVVNYNFGALTDAQGKFILKDLPSNETLIRFSAIGYTSIEQSITDSIVSVSLKPSVIVLNNNITVTARRLERNQFDVAEPVTVLNMAELSQTSPRSTPEALMGTTGIWVQKTNHGGGSPVIRGLMGNQLLLLIDGIRMNNATYRYGPNQYLSTVDPGLIERIEATRGNGSVLYGSDALGGVVQVISKSPVFSENGFRVSGMANSRWMSADMEKSVRGEFQLSHERVALLGGFSHRDYGDIHAGGKFGTLTPSAYHELSGDGKLLLRTRDAGILTVAHQQLIQHDVPRYDQVVQGGYSKYEFEPQKRQLSYLRWETLTENKLIHSLRATAALNRSVEGLISQKSESDNEKRNSDVVDTWSFITEFHSQFNSSWNAQSGFEYYHDNVSSKAKAINNLTGEEIKLRGAYADGSTSDNLAIFSNHEINLNKFIFSSGARFNMVTIAVKDTTFGNQKITPSALVGNIGMTYKANENHHIILAASSGFRAPNVDDMSKFGAVESNVYEIPSSSLSPERSFSMELGLKSTTKDFSGSFALYKTQLSNLIDRMATTYQGADTIENRRVYQKQNISRSALFGFEAEGEWQVTSSLAAFGNITYTYGEHISKDEPMRRIPPLFGKAGVRYTHTSGFWARAEYLAAGDQARLAGGDKNDNRITVRLVDGVMPGWNVLNLYAGYQRRSFNLTISGQNIFDKSYRIYASGVDAYGRCLSISGTIRL